MIEVHIHHWRNERDGYLLESRTYWLCGRIKVFTLERYIYG